jgi:hypothetical protein
MIFHDSAAFLIRVEAVRVVMPFERQARKRGEALPDSDTGQPPSREMQLYMDSIRPLLPKGTRE